VWGNTLILADAGAEAERMLHRQRRLTEYIVLTDETTCGIGCCKGKLLQRFANKKAYVILYGILGCIFSASYSYFNGTITTLEKRFKIPSKTTGTLFIFLRLEVLDFLPFHPIYLFSVIPSAFLACAFSFTFH
jgi:hypothetical protein